MMQFLLDGFLIMMLLMGLKALRDQKEQYQEILTLKSDLSSLLRQLQSAMKAASVTTGDLKNQMTYVSEKLIPHMPKISTLKEDLTFLISHGENIADRLEKLSSHAKTTILSPQPLRKEIQQPLTPPPSPRLYVEEDEKMDPLPHKQEQDEEATSSLKKNFFSTLARFR